MRISIHQVGPFYVNCYVVSDEGTGETAVIDPGGVSDELLMQLDSIGKERIKYILLTHFHFDHIMGVTRLKKIIPGARLLIHSSEAEGLRDPELNGADEFGMVINSMPPADGTFEDGDIIELGDSRLRVMHTPGHTAGSCCFIGDGVIFTGDTLFNMDIGRTDLPTGSMAQLVKSLGALAALEGDYDLYPGHEDKTTLSFEREHNPYLKR